MSSIQWLVILLGIIAIAEISEAFYKRLTRHFDGVWLELAGISFAGGLLLLLITLVMEWRT